MQIQIKLFASLPDHTGQRELVWPVKKDSTVEDVFEEMSRKYPGIAGFKTSLLFAVNESYVSKNHVMQDGDELALIPPVSGG